VSAASREKYISHGPTQKDTDKKGVSRFAGKKRSSRMRGKNIIMQINELTYKINGAIYEVNRILGYGFLEKVNENALLLELIKRNLSAEAQVPIDVTYKGEIVGEYMADIY
jgi:hypothetical protein